MQKGPCRRGFLFPGGRCPPPAARFATVMLRNTRRGAPPGTRFARLREQTGAISTRGRYAVRTLFVGALCPLVGARGMPGTRSNHAEQPLERASELGF